MEEILKSSKEKKKENAKKYYEENKDKILQRFKLYREENKEAIKSLRKKHYEENKIEILEKCKEYREENKEYIKKWKHDYYQKEDNKKKRNEKDKLRKRTDIVFRLISNVRSQVHKILTEYKNNSTYELLGCNKEQLKYWLEYQFNEKLSWDNYGTYWHVDHVIPLVFFDLINSKEQFIAFNWSNLKPLPATENLSKNDSIVKDYIISHMHTLQKFITLNTTYQANMKTCWWLRLELSYGNNEQDDSEFNLRKLIIRSEDTNSDDIISEITTKMRKNKISR
jgi:hypothetical protein